MSSKRENIFKRNHQNKLKNEKASKGLFDTVYIPKNMNSIRILPISNIFYGSDNFSLFSAKLRLLNDHIDRINDMENGAFFLGGNLFYYPPGKTDEKESFARRYINDLSEILSTVDKNKILFAYDGTNEEKFKDDRKLLYPIETTKILAENLGISDRYYADTKVELDFVFNNELTDFKNQFMYGLFTSLRPISVTKNAILNKFKNNSSLNGNKTFVIDTSSSQFVMKKKKLVVYNNPLSSKCIDVTWLSVPGYTEHPQTLNKGNLYTVNKKFIELKVEPRNTELGQQTTKKINTIKDDEWQRSLEVLTIGVDYEKYFDPVIYEELNKTLVHGLHIKEELIDTIKERTEAAIIKKQSELINNLYEKKDNVAQNKSNENGFTFE